MDAISIDGVARVDDGRCIGYGLCASTCPESAIVLHRRKLKRRTLINSIRMHLRMFADRRGPLIILALGIRKAKALKI